MSCFPSRFSQNNIVIFLFFCVSFTEIDLVRARKLQELDAYRREQVRYCTAYTAEMYCLYCRDVVVFGLLCLALFGAPQFAAGAAVSARH